MNSVEAEDTNIQCITIEYDVSTIAGRALLGIQQWDNECFH